MNKMRHAKDEKCCKCEEMATVFVGLRDPDATAYPMCNKHAEEWRMEVLLALAEQKTEKFKAQEDE